MQQKREEESKFKTFTQMCVIGTTAILVPAVCILGLGVKKVGGGICFFCKGLRNGIVNCVKSCK